MPRPLRPRPDSTWGGEVLRPRDHLWIRLVDGERDPHLAESRGHDVGAVMRTRQPAGDGRLRCCDTARDVLAHHAPAVAGVRHTLAGCTAIAAAMAEEVMYGHVPRVRAGRARQSRCQHQRRRRREVPPAAGSRPGPRLVGQREHDPAHRGSVPDARCGEGLRYHYPKIPRAFAVDADVAQPGARQPAAEPPAHGSRHGRVVGRAGYPDPQRLRGAIAGAKLRLVERLAAREQACDRIETTALDERRLGRQAAVGGTSAVDRADRVGAGGDRREE